MVSSSISPHLHLLTASTHRPHHLLYPLSSSSAPSSPFFLLHFPSPTRSIAISAVIGAQGRGVDRPALLRRPLETSSISLDDVDVADVDEESGGEDDDGEERRMPSGRERSRGGGRRVSRDADWVNWEDQILQDTVPLVGFVRMILQSGKYQSGDRLSPEHEKAIRERLLVYHPQSEKKIGCGIDFLTIGYHPDFENSRCLFIVRVDGELVDFSYWKCIKALIRKKYPLYADGFILRHFDQRRQE